jgi:hypothetical protein
MRSDRDHHDHRKHQERVGAAAGKDAVRHVEQVNRDRQHQQVYHDREYAHRHKVTARICKTLAQHVAEFTVGGALMQRRRSATPAAAAAIGAAVAASNFGRDGSGDGLLNGYGEPRLLSRFRFIAQFRSLRLGGLAAR